MRNSIQRAFFLLLTFAVIAYPVGIGEKPGANAATLSVAQSDHHAEAEPQKMHFHQHAGEEGDIAGPLLVDEKQSGTSGDTCHPCCISAFGACAVVLPEPVNLPDGTISLDHLRLVIKTVQVLLVAPLPHPPKSMSA